MQSDLLPEVLSRDTEATGSGGALARDLVQNPIDVFSLESARGLRQRLGFRARLVWASATGRQLFRKVTDRDGPTAAQDHRTMKDMIQLPDVAGIVVVHQDRPGFGRDLDRPRAFG